MSCALNIFLCQIQLPAICNGRMQLMSGHLDEVSACASCLTMTMFFVTFFKDGSFRVLAIDAKQINAA